MPIAHGKTCHKCNDRDHCEHKCRSGKYRGRFNAKINTIGQIGEFDCDDEAGDEYDSFVVGLLSHEVNTITSQWLVTINFN